MKLAIITITCFLILIFVILAVFMARDVLQETVVILLRAVGFGVPISLAVITALIAVALIMKIKEHNAQQQALARGSRLEVMTQPPGHVIYTFDHETEEYRNLPLTAAALFGPNGQLKEELDRWLTFNILQTISQQPRIAGGKGLAALTGLDEQQQPIDLFTYMRRVDRGLIVGGSEAGKSNFMKWLALDSLQRGAVFVLDPHAAPDTWPKGTELIGRGSNHAEIERALDAFITKMKNRYKEIGRGDVPEMGHDLLTILVDEYMSIESRDVANQLSCLLRESRKASMRLFVGSHSKTVKALGLKGADERDGFAIIIFHWDQVTEQRSAWVELPTPSGKAERVPAILPPEFAGGGWRVEQPSQVLDLDELGPEGKEEQVIQLFLEGNSMRDITTAVWGQHGTWYNKKVEKILAKWEVPASQ
jgi:hypothetical protein